MTRRRQILAGEESVALDRGKLLPMTGNVTPMNRAENPLKYCLRRQN
jgi:hypothetical protein